MSHYHQLQTFIFRDRDENSKEDLEIIKFETVTRFNVYDGKGRIIGVDLSTSQIKDLVELLNSDKGIN